MNNLHERALRFDSDATEGSSLIYREIICQFTHMVQCLMSITLPSSAVQGLPKHPQE